MTTPRNEWQELQAGPLRMWYADGELRYVRCADNEILRRVYVAVRDRHWNTIPVQISNLTLDQNQDSFRLTFAATHQQDELDFAWEGLITGASDGALSFTMAGQARRTFWRNRIGLCVLHSPAALIDKNCKVAHADGSKEPVTISPFIAPHQPCVNIRSFTHEIVPGLRAALHFEGDVFEIEDQRNWTDGSFKTYSTPLTLPFPVEVAAGTPIQQTLTLTLQGALTATRAARLETDPVTLTIGATPIGRLPQLGLGLAGHGQALSDDELQRLRALNLAHLRVDLHLNHLNGRGWPDWQTELARAVREAAALNAKLEIAVFLSAAGATELQQLHAAVLRLRPAVARWLIMHEDEPVTAPHWLEKARAVLRNGDKTAPIGAGTNHYFAELNRQRPPRDYPAEVVCYSINPQVHATDEISIIETLETQAATVISARQFLGAVPLAITPITLKPRFNPHANVVLTDTRLAAQITASELKELPFNVDARQSLPFAAVWTLGSLKYLAESEVASVTYHETTGWRGLMETATGSAGSTVPPGTVYALYEMLAGLGAYAGATVLPTHSNQPLTGFGLTLRLAGKLCLWLANVSHCAQRMRVRLPAHGITSQDTSDALELVLQPEEIRRIEW